LIIWEWLIFCATLYILLNVKGKKTGGALALTKWLLGQVGKFPRTLYGKKADKK